MHTAGFREEHTNETLCLVAKDRGGRGVVGFDGSGERRCSGTVGAESQRGTGLCPQGLGVSWYCCVFFFVGPHKAIMLGYLPRSALKAESRDHPHRL